MIDINSLKRIGICAHSYEGGALCFLTACREGAKALGPHMHPNIVVSAIPMGLSMPAWESDDYDGVAIHLRSGVEELRKGGADFFICPDNTAHLVLDRVVRNLPLPGLHIADVVCQEIADKGWQKVALLGTKWTMAGSVYTKAFEKKKLTRLVPDETVRKKINDAIFDELCQGIFKQETIDVFTGAIEDLKNQGAECVILGCTEIPLIINETNSALPVLDSTRLLAKYAVGVAISDSDLASQGWIDPGQIVAGK